ncbi:hypothetical protein CUTER_09010 [Corynebacterium uterequi]|uniref:Uncharacterized protein n=1 Tax=Corynebacterium uterequi TaxID=1072256 RepID=A0A0G3HEP9_9CORY|nr:hypothetical protein CUTER_09010 [Corynebacterium uterequi]
MENLSPTLYNTITSCLLIALAVATILKAPFWAGAALLAPLAALTISRAAIMIRNHRKATS